MKKILFAIAVLTFGSIGCNRADESLLPAWRNIAVKLQDTNLSAIDVIKSADMWQATMQYCYTEKGAKGDMVEAFDCESKNNYLLGVLPHTFSVDDDLYLSYSHSTSYVNMPGVIIEYDFTIVDNLEYVLHHKFSNKEYSFKIIAYDENSLVVETDIEGYSKSINFDPQSGKHEIKEYPYSIFVFRKRGLFDLTYYLNEEDFNEWLKENVK